jgi:hypothetical protein
MAQLIAILAEEFTRDGEYIDNIVLFDPDRGETVVAVCCRSRGPAVIS